MSFFRTYVSPTLGGTGRKDAFAEVNLTLAQLFAIGGAFPGETGCLWGKRYQLVQNRSGGDMTVGQAASMYFGAASRIGNLTSASTTSILTTDDTHDAGLSGSRDFPGQVGVTAGVFATTAAEQRRDILASAVATTASTLTIAEADFSDGTTNGAASLSPDVIAAVDNTFDYEVVCPWEVTLADSDALITSLCHGIVVSTTITNGNFGIVQLPFGLAMANVDGTVDLVAGDYLAVGSTGGVLEKWAPTTTAATLAQLIQGLTVCGRIMGAYTANSTGLRLIQLGLGPVAPQPTPY